MRELEKILEEIKEMLEDNKVFDLNSDGTLDKCIIDVQLAWNDIKDIIRKHMNDGWIPVEERLPEGKTRVICQFDNGDIEMLWQDWENDPETLTYLADFDFMAEKVVVAWRPLPEPYIPERSDNHDRE